MADGEKWGAAGGWRDAIAADFKRTTKTVFPNRPGPALKYVTATFYQGLLKRLGPEKVQLKNFVVVCKDKFDSGGVWVKCGARIVIADNKGSGEAPFSFWGTVQQEVVRVLSQGVAQVPGAFIVINDCEGAYYHGNPPDPEGPNGRYVLCRIPPEFAQFGFPPRHQETGELMYMLVEGNMPGLQTAGRIWGQAYEKFMTLPEPEGVGLLQSVVDRRLFYKVGKGGKLDFAVGVHVDDNCCAVHNEPTFNVYEKRWNERFGKPGDAARGAGCGSLQPAKAEMKPRVPTEVQFFTGIRVRQYPGLVLHDAPRLLDKLEELLGRVPTEVNGRLDCSSPLPGNGLAGLRAAGPESPVLPDSERDAYWSMHGLSGYIVGKARPDGQLGFIATAQQFALNFNPYVRARVVQLAAYLIDTRDLALTFRKRPGNATDGILQLEVWSDSSALNGPEAGRSWGGGCTGVPGSGLVSWKAHAPKKPADSSGAA